MSVVVLMSGGVDSTLIALLASESGNDPLPLFVNYGQLAVREEWKACVRQCRKLDLRPPTRMNLAGFGRAVPSGLTSSRKDINRDAFLPCRNMLFLCAGAAYAAKHSVDTVAIGLLDPSAAIFPDQTPDFLAAAEQAIMAALGYRIAFIAPLFGFSKHAVLELAKQKRIVGTYSCHSGRRRRCGVCVSCLEQSQSR